MYMYVGNFVLLRLTSKAGKRDFWLYIWQYTSPNENVEYGYPNLYAPLRVCVTVER